MKVLGILGSMSDDGVTAKMLHQVLKGVSNDVETETIFLADYHFKPDSKGYQDPVLDELEAKLLASDVWVIAAPTYWGSLAGEMKFFFDCMKQRLVRFDRRGNLHADRFVNKHYLSLTNCYTGKWENRLSGVTDPTFNLIDKVLGAAGLIKIHELVVTGTYGLQELPADKRAELLTWGQKLNQIQKRDDNTMKRYLQLFMMVAVMALVTMGLQVLMGLLVVKSFLITYSSFVLIFYCLLAVILHVVTFMKHKRS